MKGPLAFVLLLVSYTLAVPAGQPQTGSHLDREFMSALSDLISAVYQELTAEEAALVTLNADCQTQIEGRVDQCNTCVTANCQQASGPSPSLPDTILNTVVLQPVKKAGAELKKLGAGLSNVAKKGVTGAENVFNKIIINPANKVGDGVKKAVSEGKKVLDKAGSTLKTGFEKVKDWFGDTFGSLGRKKRQAATTPAPLDAETLQCYNGPCNAECTPFLNADTTQDEICGAALGQRTALFLESAKDLNAITTTVNTTELVLNKVWVQMNGEITGYEALMSTGYVIQVPETILTFPSFWSPPDDVKAFWRKFALDYYSKFATAV